MDKAISTLNVSELICTRISHDLIGNIGAFSNAVELLEEGDLDFIDDIKSILKTSSSVLSARMKFFRMAFGSDNANLEHFPLVIKTIEDYLKSVGNHSYDIELDFDIKDSKFTKFAMISAMLVSDIFVRGGKISIKQNDDELKIVSNNNNMLKDKVFIIKEVISGNIVENLAQYAPILYLKEIMKNTKYSIYLEEEEGLSFIIR